MQVFKDYAKYYNLLYKDKDYSGEVEYVNSLIQKHSIQPNPESLLDFGCGTGKHAMHFSDKGYMVTGIDISEEMIERANQLSINNCTFHRGDVTTIKLPKQFDVVVSLFHVASYQTSNSSLNRYFNNANKHLKTNGLFIFDFWYGPAVLSDLPSVRVKKFEDDESFVTRISTPVLHPNKNMVEVHFEIHIEDRKSSKVNKINEQHNMRYLFLPEMESFLSTSGFKIVGALKWMSMDESLSCGSWNGVLICRKNTL